MMVRNKIFLLCSSNRRCRLERRFFSKSGGHVVITGLPPRLICTRHPPKTKTTAWHHDRNLTAAMALAAGIAATVARLRYGETVPYSGRTHLALLSHEEARRRGEAAFAEFKRDNAWRILDPCHPLTIRVQRITNLIIRAAHHGLAIKELQARSSRPDDGLQWLEGLEWEVVILRDRKHNAKCFPGAGKIVVNTQLLHNFNTDAEIADTIAHEVGHVIARHSSGILQWLYPIFEGMPILIFLAIPFILPFNRRRELEADHIGMLLLAAAGVHPAIAVLVRQKEAEMRGGDSTFKEFLSYFSTHPSYKKRRQFLSQRKVMDEALELYRQVVTHAQGWGTRKFS